MTKKLLLFWLVMCSFTMSMASAEESPLPPHGLPNVVSPWRLELTYVPDIENSVIVVTNYLCDIEISFKGPSTNSLTVGRGDTKYLYIDSGFYTWDYNQLSDQSCINSGSNSATFDNNYVYQLIEGGGEIPDISSIIYNNLDDKSDSLIKTNGDSYESVNVDSIENTNKNNEIANNRSILISKGELGYDDGEKDGAGSDSPRGQAVFFPIDSKLKINGIKFYGSRYDGISRQFEIEIWDSNYKTLYSSSYDYVDYFPEFYNSKKELKYSWVEIEMQDIEITDDFYVALFTYSGPPSWKSKDYPGIPIGGIYLGLDNDTKSGNSYMVNKNPNRIITWPTSWNLRQESTDWMIRVNCASDENCGEAKTVNSTPTTLNLLTGESEQKTISFDSGEIYKSSICRECHGYLHSIIYKPKFIYDDDAAKSGWYYSNQILSNTYAAPIKGILGFFIQFSNENYVKVPDNCEVSDSL